MYLRTAIVSFVLALVWTATATAQPKTLPPSPLLDMLAKQKEAQSVPSKTQASEQASLEQKENSKEAERDQSTRLKQKDPVFYCERGDRWFEKEEFMKAASDYAEAIRLAPKHSEYHAKLGKTWAAKSYYRRAIAAYDEAIRIDPNNASLYNLRGLARYSEGTAAWFSMNSFTKSIVDFDRAIDLDSTKSDYFHNRGLAWHKSADYSKAIQDFDAAIRISPKCVRHYIERDQSRHAKAGSPKVLAEFDEAISIDPNNSALYSRRGNLWLMNGEHTKAMADFDAAVGIESNNPIYYRDRGLVWYNKADYSRAIENYEEAILRGNDSAAYYDELGSICFRKASYSKAITSYSEAIRINPKESLYYRNRGNSRLYAQDISSAHADLITADLLQVKRFDQVNERDLEDHLRTVLTKSRQLTLVVVVPQFREAAPITLYALNNGQGLHRNLRCDVTSQSVWNTCVKMFAQQATMVTSVRECDSHESPFFRESRGVQVQFDFGEARELNVAPDRTLKLTPQVLKHFQVIRESDYKSDRTAVIITEAHESLDAQIASYRGLEALLRANPWMKSKGESAFLVEAWAADSHLSIEPLVRAQPKPSEGLVMAALGTALVPSYVAIEWKHQNGIPLIGHEDLDLYKFCNYMHWATYTRRWTGDELGRAENLRDSSVQARNESSGKTFVRALRSYNCPLLFIGYGHVGPHPFDATSATAREIEDLVEQLEYFVPGQSADWIKNVSKRSVASYLKENRIGFVMLQARRNQLLDSSISERAFTDYTQLRKAQHDGSVSTFLGKFGKPKTTGCTTMPDPESLAKIISSLESMGLPDGAMFTSRGQVEQLIQLLADCGSILGCFPARTIVRTDAGDRAIETLKHGEFVWGFDLDTGEWGKHQVDELIQTEYSGDFVSITIGQSHVSATGNHPFWVCSGEDLTTRPDASHISTEEQGVDTVGRWVNARDLRLGDNLLSANGMIKVTAVATEELQQVVYTLRVANVHNFAVGTAGLLVHNNCSWVPPRLFRDPKFEKNLISHLQKLDSGFIKPVQSAAHHLIPVAEAQQSTFMRAAAKLGYNINRPQNGIFLPRSEEAAKALGIPFTNVHRGNHQGYSDYVAGRLKKLDAEFANSFKGQTQRNRDAIMKRVGSLEKDLRSQLRMGKLDLGD